MATTGQQGEDFGAVVVPEGSDVTDVSELGDATIAVNNLENIGDTSVRNSIREAGGDPSDVEFLELDFPDMPAALDQGEIDAAWVVEPFLSAALDAGATELASNFADVHDELTIAVYFTSEQVMQEDPETVAAFAAAMDRALAHADDNPDEVRRIIGDYTEIAPGLIESMRLPAFPPEPHTDSVQVLADLMEEDGLVDELPDLDELFAEQPCPPPQPGPEPTTPRPPHPRRSVRRAGAVPPRAPPRSACAGSCSSCSLGKCCPAPPPRHLVWPTALPYLITGLRLGAAVALILTITAQLVIGSPGLGQEIAVAQSSGAPHLVYALIVATGILGVLVNTGVRALEHRVLHWHPSVRGEVPA